uniref:Vacuolar ATP synthase (E subunit), putative n=1 Tax=Theileria annulata TaxID=5874 RepID=A0A3B0N2D8_THEAN
MIKFVKIIKDAIEAQNQIKQMINFILNEAKDKAEEIESGAIEEFNIEKMNLFEQKKDEVRSKILKNINDLRLKKMRQRNVELKKMSNNILMYQCEVVDELKKLALDKLYDLSQNRDEYKKILKMLILSGCLSLDSDIVYVRYRPSDSKVVESTLGDVKSEYERLTELKYEIAKTITLELDRDNHLSEDVLGVVLTNEDGTIECNSTLNNRLEMCCREMIPQIKLELFSSVGSK